MNEPLIFYIMIALFVFNIKYVYKASLFRKATMSIQILLLKILELKIKDFFTQVIIRELKLKFKAFVF